MRRRLCPRQRSKADRGCGKTKMWVICEHSPEDQDNALKQIADAEKQKKIQYFISAPGCYYEIEFGLLKGGGKGG